jgi:hypothetical protein
MGIGALRIFCQDPLLFSNKFFGALRFFHFDLLVPQFLNSSIPQSLNSLIPQFPNSSIPKSLNLILGLSNVKLRDFERPKPRKLGLGPSTKTKRGRHPAWVATPDFYNQTNNEV